MYIYWCLTTVILVPALASNISGGSVQELWGPVLKVWPKCPRFVSVESTHDGLGDQLERLFAALSLAWRHRDSGITLVVSKDFGSEGKIHGHDYHNILTNVLGVPTDAVLRTEDVLKKWKPQVRNIVGNYGDYVSDKRNFTEDTPCNTLTTVDIYDGCNGRWCPLLWLDQINEGLGDLIPETYRLHGSYCSTEGKENFNLKNLAVDTINVVWHIRNVKGGSHTCRACKPEYLNRVNDFVNQVIGNASDGSRILNRSDTIVYRLTGHKDKEQLGPLNHMFPMHMTSESLEKVLCTFATADLLVATGSSLPATFSYFLPQRSPVILEDYRMLNDHDLFQGLDGAPVPFQYVAATNRSFHLEDGKPAASVTAGQVASAIMDAKRGRRRRADIL